MFVAFTACSWKDGKGKSQWGAELLSRSKPSPALVSQRVLITVALLNSIVSN